MIDNILTMHVQSPWYDEILSERKIIEGRNGPMDKFINRKKMIIKNDVDFALVDVIDVKHYNNLHEYVNGSGWENIAPHVSSYEETILEYRKIKDSKGEYVFSDDMIKSKGGMNAIYLKLSVL